MFGMHSHAKYALATSLALRAPGRPWELLPVMYHAEDLNGAFRRDAVEHQVPGLANPMLGSYETARRVVMERPHSAHESYGT